MRGLLRFRLLMGFRHRSAVIVVVQLASLILGLRVAMADDTSTREAPKSEAAREATLKAERLQTQADAAWLSAMVTVWREESAELKAAEKAALQKDDLPEANAIARLLKELQGKIDGAIGKKTLVKVRADRSWEPVAKLPKGRFLISAAGRWTTDVRAIPPHSADGQKNRTLHGIPYGMLVARVGALSIRAQLLI